MNILSVSFHFNFCSFIYFDFFHPATLKYNTATRESRKTKNDLINLIRRRTPCHGEAHNA